MTNTVVGAELKMLTFLPFALALFFYDFPSFAVILSVTYLPFFMIAITLFFLGILVKARIFPTVFRLSKGSFTWGAVLLAFSALLYIYGSYSFGTAWYHFESLYLFGIAYVAFRIGTKILRSMAPLLVILAFAFAPFGLWPAGAQAVIVLALVYVYAVSFLVYVRPRLRLLLLPGVVLSVGVLAWYLTGRLEVGMTAFLFLAIVSPLLILLLPRARGFLLPQGYNEKFACPGHVTLTDGFCALCGKRIGPPVGRENFGTWGLLTLGFVTLLLVFTSVPALALVGGAPYHTQFSARGLSATPVPLTPAGWQANSTTIDTAGTGDVYAMKSVYVPVYHPETKNYTVFYEIAIGPPVSGAPNGGDIPGWNITSNTFTELGALQGYLSVYSGAGLTMLSYHGKTAMQFMNGGSFQSYYVGMGFVREFKNANVASDTAQFLAEVKSLWLPGVLADLSYSTWTGFLSDTYSGANFIAPTIVLFASVGLIGWFAGLALRNDNRLDRFLTMSTGLSENDWTLLSRLMAMRKGNVRGLGLEPDSIEPTRVSALLEGLERRGLVKRELVETGFDLTSSWKLAV